MKKRFTFKSVILIMCMCLFLSVKSYASDTERGWSTGQLVYVPAYSHIYSGSMDRPTLLTVTLSIRNVDPKNTIKIISVDYYETQGKLLKNYLKKPLSINPLGAERYIVPQKDTSGGSGANFLVEWQSEKPVNPPIIESVMISTQMQQGISFTSRGREILVSEK